MPAEIRAKATVIGGGTGGGNPMQGQIRNRSKKVPDQTKREKQPLQCRTAAVSPRQETNGEIKTLKKETRSQKKRKRRRVKKQKSRRREVESIIQKEKKTR